MISRIEGEISELGENCVILKVHGVYYEIQAIRSVLERLARQKKEEKAELVIYHYVQTDPSKSIPIMLGFNNTVEREFFIKFITVSGIGPKAALRALSVPISQIAHAIDDGDIKFLKTLPGVGEQRAREIVAKLQGKVARFGLIQDGAREEKAYVKLDFEKEALAVLSQLQYKNDEAKRMIELARMQNPGIRSVEELLNEIYRQRSKEPSLIA